MMISEKLKDYGFNTIHLFGRLYLANVKAGSKIYVPFWDKACFPIQIDNTPSYPKEIERK